MYFIGSTLKKLTQNVANAQVRHLKLLEYQSKSLMKHYNVTVQNFCVVDKTNTANFDRFKAKEYVIKPQILAGGRGKGHFDNGLRGGVHFARTRSKVIEVVEKMMGHRLITKHTSEKGIPVDIIMIAESVKITRETYFCISLSCEHDGPVIIMSAAGGDDIEEITNTNPQFIQIIPIDIYKGVSDRIALDVADYLEFKGALRKKAAGEIKNLWNMFVKVDATQLEINPLAQTANEKVVVVDAKVSFDDNAKFRQQDIFDMESYGETNPREIDAKKHDMSYTALSGNIGCLVNGAGLAMSTLDIIKLHGGEPANLLYIRGVVSEDQIRIGFKIICTDTNVKVILVNIFGGFVNCAMVAKGIVAASEGVKLPLIVRLRGIDEEEAADILKNSKLDITPASGFEEAAQKCIAKV